MNPSKGYYSLIQYCPDLTMAEAANVGVLLFCPEKQFLKAVTIGNNSRVIRFFGSMGNDWDRLNVLKKGFEDRLLKESSGIRTADDLKQFIATRANLLQVTTPRPMKVVDPEQDLEDLFVQVFGSPAKERSKKSLRTFVGEHLLLPDLKSKVAQNIPVNVPALGKSVEIPFGFQNGRFNLITPVRFGAADPEQSAVHACKYAVEGRSLYENPDSKYGALQLLIVGRFRPKDTETPKRVERVFSGFNVRLLHSDQLNQLADEIRKTGKVLV